MKNSKRKIPELLAPAGNKEAFIAAVEAGADAIYLGGEILNARMGAGNFSMSELEEAFDFAHKRHVKVYVTVNTLVTDSEMKDALLYSGKLYEMGADALIIQDQGLGYLIKKHMPDFPIHLSTQGSIYDLEGVQAAGELGYERVVLARELSMDEINNIASNTETEIEVFCHGALCICYSGQCQMSRAIGARSGNRGACAQPCRLLYEMERNGEWTNKGYYLSPSDFNLIDYIGSLAEAGVASIKIEGRMKSPEYVGTVTSIYRKYLDMYSEKGSYEVTAEDRASLIQIFNRGFTTGYMTGEDEELMSGKSPKHKGVYAGTVLSVKGIKGKTDRSIITASAALDIKKGDVLEIGKSAHAKVTLLEGKAPRLEIGDVIGEVEKGDEIYRMVSEEQMETAGVFYKNKDWHEGRFIRKTELYADVVSGNDGSIKLVLKDALTGERIEVAAEGFESSDTSVASRIEESLKKTGGTPFVIQKINLRGDLSYNIPVSKINELRRMALADMEDALVKKRILPDDFNVEKIFDEKDVARERKEYSDEENCIELFFYTADDFLKSKNIPGEIEKSGVALKNVFVLLPAADIVDYFDQVKEKVKSINAKLIPYISNISKGEENKIINNHFNFICDVAREDGIYIGNLNWIKRFMNEGISVHADYGFNKYNSWTEMALLELGIASVSDSLECDDIGSGNFGSAPLMTSEHSFKGEALRDRKGKIYRIIHRDFSDQDIIAPAEVKSLSATLKDRASGDEKEGIRLRVYM